MTAFEQFVFDLEWSEPDSAPEPAVKRNVAAGPARLLRKLVSAGLDPEAIESAAALVAALDEEPTS
jgi:hypothetical protein